MSVMLQCLPAHTQHCKRKNIFYYKVGITVHWSTITNMAMVWSCKVMSKKLNMIRAYLNFLFALLTQFLHMIVRTTDL
jgi:hypothetical protein